MTRYTQIGRPVEQADGWWVTDLAARVGVASASKKIGISRATLAAVIAGLPIAATTEERVRHAREQDRRAA
jgi:hypothetical protein